MSKERSDRSELPEWIEKIKSREYHNVLDMGLDFEKCVEALEIAWEALRKICVEPLGPSGATHKEILGMAEQIGKDALRRIEELGK